ncbi:MAG TPA: RluA family pseudouridine synthase [Burkholderiaceae bacterium]
MPDRIAWNAAPLYLDDDLLVLEKPAGLLCVPGRGADKADCLSARAQACYPDACVVHRLDMATSGLVLMARGGAMQAALGTAFAQRAVHKRYEALVHGSLPHGHGEIDLPLCLDWPNRPKSHVNRMHGKPSVTRWQRLGAGPPTANGSATTRLALFPLTGRSHQLRVHLQALGHPIVGDALYHPDGAPRLMLHACTLQFTHPRHGITLMVQSPVPF